MRIHIPDEAKYIIETLENSGHEAHVVGGCVRDALMGKTPEDWDITTSALPSQTMACFEGSTIIETGLQHGTLTLVLSNKPFEITTFRADGNYSDFRRPDNVEFIRELKSDLARRDFTINAMAYNPGSGISDFFGGIEDIENKIIRCVGDADTRFREDALRIMRALRFSSVLDFEIEKNTAASIFNHCDLLPHIARERISNELSKLLLGKRVLKILSDYTRIFEEIIPEISETVGFEQNTPYHHLDVWNHIIASVAVASKDKIIRLTMLLHDIAKPKCYMEIDSVGHFHGHEKLSSFMAKDILSRLKYDGETIDAVTQLILHHGDDIVAERKSVKRWLNRIGEERFHQLIEVRKSDLMAKVESKCESRMSKLPSVLTILDEIIAQQQCFSLKDLAIDGNDLLALGIPEGKEVGDLLNYLLDMVINENANNEKEELLHILQSV